jgi:electron transport complex protein RnfG
MMKKIKLTFTLFIIAALSGLLISSVYGLTQPTIEKNAADKEKGLYQELFSEVDSFEKVIAPSEEIDEQVVIYDADKKIIGYIYKATGVNGYGSITVLTGIDAKGNVTGIKYSSFSQTPGFGDKVKKDVFLNQFPGMSTENVVVDAMAGATYSSNTVKDVVTICATYHNENIK